MRTFSHNLALVPPLGQGNVHWHQSQTVESAKNATILNLLLIPFPYRIPNHSFRGMVCTDSPKTNPWGRFRIDQKWLHQNPLDAPGDEKGWSTHESRVSFISFVDKILARAKKKKLDVNGIILPEYALDWISYDAMVRHLRDSWPHLEFVISGVSNDCSNRPGNQVVFSRIHEGAKPQNRIIQTHSRRKHHRWFLDKKQIENYGLQNELDANYVWWEYLEIEERDLHIDVFRNGSTLTAVICEDLARVDPGLSLLSPDYSSRLADVA